MTYDFWKAEGEKVGVFKALHCVAAFEHFLGGTARRKAPSSTTQWMTNNNRKPALD